MNSANTPLLETERLILRKFTENDLEALFNIYSNEEVEAGCEFVAESPKARR